jgi:hypothetical protein
MNEKNRITTIAHHEILTPWTGTGKPNYRVSFANKL